MHIPVGIVIPDLVFLLAVLLAFFNAQTFARALENLQNAFRGGPRPPSHPLPSNDAPFLTRRRSRVQHR
jgi:hypothetical protein